MGTYFETELLLKLGSKITEPNDVHKEVIKIFDIGEHEKTPRSSMSIIYSYKYKLSSVSLIIRSLIAPNIDKIKKSILFDSVININEFSFNDIFCSDKRIYFKIHVSPSMKQKGGKREPIIERDSIAQWFLSKIENGLIISDLRVEHNGAINICKKRNFWANSSHIFGKMEIENISSFEDIFINGFGRLNSYGFGMLEC